MRRAWYCTEMVRRLTFVIPAIHHSDCWSQLASRSRPRPHPAAPQLAQSPNKDPKLELMYIHLPCENQHQDTLQTYPLSFWLRVIDN